MKRHIQRMKTIKLMKIMLLIGIMTWVLFLIYCRAVGPLDIVWK